VASVKCCLPGCPEADKTPFRLRVQGSFANGILQSRNRVEQGGDGINSGLSENAGKFVDHLSLGKSYRGGNLTVSGGFDFYQSPNRQIKRVQEV